MEKVQSETNATRKSKPVAKKSVSKRLTRKPASQKKVAVAMGLKKQYFKKKNVCKVTFRLPVMAVPNAKTVCIVGDFNQWGIYANPMKRLKNGDYSIMLELEPGKEYQFRYYIDDSHWENHWNADKYVKNPFGDSDNSVVVT